MRVKASHVSNLILVDSNDVRERASSEESKVAAICDVPACDAESELGVTDNELLVIDGFRTSHENNMTEFMEPNSDDVVLDNDFKESIRALDEVINSVSQELNIVESAASSKNEPSAVVTREMKNSDEVRIKSSEVVCNDTLAVLPNIGNGRLPRQRKLSLDHTALARDGLSQSEVDLHSVGKSPLERKSSFFRKKMESFLKNTSEVFRRQSIKRRGSMSYSMQSLNENSVYSGRFESPTGSQELRGSIISLASTAADSTSSPIGSQGRLYIVDGQQIPAATEQGHLAAESAQSLKEALLAESLMSSRAISMSSGLDNAQGSTRRRQANRANRVTWLASEGLTNYLRRMIQDEKTREQSVGTELAARDTKGRRLSYQRAVSGEDPVRYQEAMRRRSHIPEQVAAVSSLPNVKQKGTKKAGVELTSILNEFTRSGVPSLRGFAMLHIAEEAMASLHWSDFPKDLAAKLDLTKIPPNEESRQAVIMELVTTEVAYIQHLMAIVEVFMAAAHAIQDQGKMLAVETERLFSNIPDVLNASLQFYDVSIFPMVQDAITKQSLFNPDLMYPGFYRFREIFSPYEKLVSDQSKMVSYLKSLNSNEDFKLYLSWCHAHKSCNRLQLADLLVKPMQRLTKYKLILRRIVDHTETEPERTNLTAMEAFAKNYVTDLNRSIRQRDEQEKLDQLIAMIDGYEIDFKDDDMDRLFRAYSSLNLKAPMVGCLPHHSRSLIYQGDLKFKDAAKETKIKACGMDVRAFLLTDMLLICKKMNVKGSPFSYKLIRPKYMMDKMLHFYQFSKTRPSKDPVGLLFIMLDEVGSAFNSFALADPTKEGNPAYIKYLQTWEAKFREAKLTYDLGVSFAKDPSRDLSEVEMDSSSDNAAKTHEFLNMLTRSVSLPDNIVLCTHPSSLGDRKPSAEDLNIEREARERVAAMLHRSIDASTELEFSQASMYTDSFDATSTSGHRSLRHPMFRSSTGGSSRQSRLSSFQQSTSAASHEEPSMTRNMYRAGSSVEHHIPPQYGDEGVTSITVNVVSESESETMVPPKKLPSMPPLAVSSRPVSRSASAAKQHTLKVQPQSGVMALVHSLPDLTRDPPPRSHSAGARSPSPQSASDKLYQSHHELLNRNRLSASAHGRYLHPDHRGKSYPPPSPTSRGSLKRGLAFSYSFKYPPLAKMGHVNSQSQLPAEPTTSKESLKSEKSKEEEDKEQKEKTKEEKVKKKDKGKTKPGQKGKQSKGKTDKDKDKKEKEREKSKEGDIRQENNPKEPEVSKTQDEPDAGKPGGELTAFNIDPGEERRATPREGLLERLRFRGKSEEVDPGAVNPLLVPGTSREGPSQPPPGPTTAPSVPVSAAPAATSSRSFKGIMSSSFFTSGGWHTKLDG